MILIMINNEVDLTAGFTMEDLAAAAAAEEASYMSSAHSMHDKTVHTSRFVFLLLYHY